MNLGRGLKSLISDEAVIASAPGAGTQDLLLRLPIDRIRPNPEQPRNAFHTGALKELADSIRQHGVLIPLVVRRDPSGAYVLIAGERRLRASKLAGLKDVPVLVRGDDADGGTQLELALVENLQREDLDAIEAALGYQRLIQKYGYTQEKVAGAVGKDRVTVTNALRLLRLPEAGREALRDGRISAGHARALLPLEDAEAFAGALKTVLDRGLNVRATERLVRVLLEPGRRAPKGDNRAYVRVGEALTRRFGTRVNLAPRLGGGGQVRIDWHDAADLSRLLRLLNGDE